MSEYVWKEATGKLAVLDTKPNYNMTFHRVDKQVGLLDFNGPEMVFTGDADESAKLFFDFIARSFKERLEQERADEREKCEGAAAQAAREAIVFAMDAEREACAKVCEEFARKWWKIHCDSNLHYSSTLKAHQDFCALQAAIRARGNT